MDKQTCLYCSQDVEIDDDGTLSLHYGTEPKLTVREGLAIEYYPYCPGSNMTQFEQLEKLR